MTRALLTTRQLSQLRAQQIRLMPQSCTIYRPSTPGNDGYGSATETTTAGTVYACRLSPASKENGLAEIAERLTLEKMYVLTLPWNADVLKSDYLKIGAVDYEIIVMLNDAETFLTARRVVVKPLERTL